MGVFFNVKYTRRPTYPDWRWLLVVISMEAALLAVAAGICRLVSGDWWPPFMWVPLAVGVFAIIWGWRDRVLARRQFDNQESS